MVQTSKDGTQDHLPIRFSYYLARLHGSQELEGKYYGELKETIVLVFFNVNLIDNHRMCNTFTLKNEDGLSFVKETEDRMKMVLALTKFLNIVH